MRARVAAAVLVVAVSLLYGPSPVVSARSPAPGEGVPAFGNVFVIIGENAELGNVNKSNSPYLINTLMPVSAWHTNYFALTHNSLANYVGMTSGQFTTCEQNDDPPNACHQNVNNLFHQMDVAGLSWKSWMESMATPCDLTPEEGTIAGSNTYRVKHNPAVYYDNVEGAGGVWSATAKSSECLNNVVATGGTGPNDTSALDSALASGSGIARFNLIVPNQCEDAHDNCNPPSGNPLSQFDAFLAREVPKIQASPAFGSNGVLIVVFDEGAGDNLKNTTVYDHYSFLRTMEDGFRLAGFVGNAAAVKPVTGIWK
jgi:hypothetical protein